jgi:hypothetical protein
VNVLSPWEAAATHIDLASKLHDGVDVRGKGQDECAVSAFVVKKAGVSNRAEDPSGRVRATNVLENASGSDVGPASPNFRPRRPAPPITKPRLTTARRLFPIHPRRPQWRERVLVFQTPSAPSSTLLFSSCNTAMSTSIPSPHRSKILLLGLKRSGKTSIRQVLFGQMEAKETFYLERTTKIVKHAYDSVMPLEVWDCPGSTDVNSLGVPLTTFSSLVFVIDIQVRQSCTAWRVGF